MQEFHAEVYESGLKISKGQKLTQMIFITVIHYIHNLEFLPTK